MLERIQMIRDIGNYSGAATGQFKFSNINVIYGENRNGKSTFCDIFYSLSLNDPQLILDRKSIIPNRNPAQIQPLVELKFDGQRQAVRFANSVWETQPPVDSKLYIFDHDFIHRNVMTGSTYNRENSTNMSGFILGENAQLFEALEARNQQLRSDRSTLVDYERELNRHEIGNFNTFIALPTPTKTIHEFDVDIQKAKEAQEDLAAKIATINQVAQYPNLETITPKLSINDKAQRINNLLSLSMENVHEASKAIVTAHKARISNSDSFDGWAANGLTHLDQDCPFCGQTLDENAQHLIESYRTAFDEAFHNFVVSTKATITQLQNERLLDFPLESINQKHERNLTILASYMDAGVKAGREHTLLIF